MVDLETRLALDHDEPAVRELVNEAGATLERDSTDPAIYWLSMQPARQPDERYFVRIAWTSYPHSAPSVKFADTVRGSLNVTYAWPVIPGYRPGNFDICQPFTAEAYAIHPEWAQGPEAWPSSGNPFLWVVGRLLHDMAERYGGRSG
jgi:hypothetical protein